MTNFDEIREKHLAKSVEKLKSANGDIQREINYIREIVTHCQFLKRSPLPYLQTAQATVEPSSQTYYDWGRGRGKTYAAQTTVVQLSSQTHCPYCDFVTNKGHNGLKAHIGMKHKNKAIPK